MIQAKRETVGRKKHLTVSLFRFILLSSMYSLCNYTIPISIFCCVYAMIALAA